MRSGSRIRFRYREQIAEQKESRYGKYPDTWFLRGEVQNTLKVQSTPNSALLKDLRKVVGGKICAEGGATKLIIVGIAELDVKIVGMELWPNMLVQVVFQHIRG